MLKRRFATIDIGQVHYRTAGEEHRGNGRRPLILMHASPFPGRALSPLTEAMGTTRRAIAPDNLGQGDSCAPQHPSPTIEYFGDKLVAFLDALGIAEADLYGTHTGGHTVMDVALRYPKRVHKLILDGIGILRPELTRSYVAHLREAPPFDFTGAQMMWSFQTARDMLTFFPYYERDTAHRRVRDLPPALDIHARALELLRRRDTFHLAYIAAFQANPGGRKYSALKVPTLYTAAAMDAIEGGFEETAAMIPGVEVYRYPQTSAVDYAAGAIKFAAWLDS
ncbi:MAG: alpha/beta hydrolase [Alphaproteobacteria bacterium]|nr:alpha/beta hydrolase [Alphaproteobacteria bacterium]